MLTQRDRYFTSVFVSLGVFLFGYDQGVMSGIITYVIYGSKRIKLMSIVDRSLKIISIIPHEPKSVPW